ncbi:hypothetical protein [Candidatus Viridilinea mediisalina]|uniref:Uncharacterized protein n=1 Tax=Candidatus Viridilinea mediisalina TaxID=2024553 RepID=A0A2A6RJS6_9CHLR|nr:hypothetical protein [Candidatus Viridilinea mediisalina]PDW03272.1 hypothetical protein CJ255_09505 [Candidatus Viridilinea mediisalina]
MVSHYGNYNENKKLPLAAHIWGHRLRIGQHWIEYMLEFLGVLSGFGYRLGQGLPSNGEEPHYKTQYKIPNRLGLRRFVFYDERERTRDSRDSRAVAELRRHLAQIMPNASGMADEALVEQVRSLLRSFSAIEDERAWYAKTLFPVNEHFLLWEAMRKGATLNKYALNAEELSLDELDKDIEFRSRNFFARGGELYYLMLSAGSEHDPALRERIGQRLKYLLCEHNQALGNIAAKIDHVWTQLLTNSDTIISGTLGWLPDPTCPLYRQMAHDLDTFLHNDLDSLECLELLAHLIGFHIILYIYHRAHPASDPEGHASGSCLEACRPRLLVDLLGPQDGGVLRDQSMALLREQEDLQLRQGRQFILHKFATWFEEISDPKELHAHLIAQAHHHFNPGRAQNKQSYEQALNAIQGQAAAQSMGRDELIQRYSDAVFSALQQEFRQHFLGVHRKIGRAIGFIAPQRGPFMRFVLNDTLLKTLVMAILPNKESLLFGKFLERLYERYGIIVGPGEAHSSDLMERLRINQGYYADNRMALLERMQRAGLLTQYSDATALVRRGEA